MTDTIIKGTGNSRSLKSVPNFLTMYPTYQDFAKALINGTLPIDLGALNSAGVQTRGTDLNKANVLKDATAALYGKNSAATPDQIFAAIRPLITAAQNTADNAQNIANSATKVLAGSYTGTGGEKGFSESDPMSLTFPFAPKIVMIPFGEITKYYVKRIEPFCLGQTPEAFTVWVMISSVLTTSFVKDTGFSRGEITGGYGKKSADGKTFYWYGNKADVGPFNTADHRYYYVAIG